MLIQADIMPDRRHCFIFFMICFVIFLGLGYFSLSTVSFAFISITYLMLCMKRLLYMSLKSIIPVCLCLFSYSLEACWNSNFRASRGTKISKFSGALSLDPVGGLTAPHKPQLFAPSLRSVDVSLRLALPRFARSNLRLASVGFCPPPNNS